jgi:hypothetical protein
MWQIVSIINYLDMQDAPKKQWPALQKPGAWNGCLLETSNKRVFCKISQEQRKNACSHIRDMHCLKNCKHLNFWTSRYCETLGVFLSMYLGHICFYCHM